MGDDRARLNLKSLARHLDLSITTVSRALRNGPEVRKETIERVQKAAAELGYVRDFGGLTLRTGLSYSICVLMSAAPPDDIADTGSVGLLQGVHEVAQAAGYAVTAVPLAPGADPIDALKTIIDGRRADGLIFDHTLPMDPRVRFLLERDFPFVSFGRTELFTPHAWFDIDDEDATYRAVQHLLTSGYRRICLINPPAEFMFSQYRLRGYRKALAEAGIEIDPRLILDLDLTARRTRASVKDMMVQETPPDAFICVNDITSLGMMTGLRDIGLDPADFGFCASTTTRLIEYVEPMPVSFYFPLQEAGRRLTRLMLRRLEGETDISQLQELAVAEMHVPTRR